MIREKNEAVQILSTMGGERIEMDIDASAKAKLMGILSDLYENSILACVREYSTNADDAHRLVGQTRPIEITTPTELSMFLRIKDYGPGMDADDIRDTYSRYGRSTKDTTNEQQGVLGLGCKAGIAYTTQFTLNCVKNGVRTVVTVTRDEDGIPSMTIIDPIPTDEHSGVEVTIPVKRFDAPQFEEEAQWLFSFWEPNTVLLNGQVPEPVEGLRIADDMMVIQDSRDALDYVVMGNVPYPVRLDHGMPNSRNLITWVPMGAVDFVPAREALKQDHSATKATIARIHEELPVNLERAAQEAIDQAASKPEAVQVWREWRDALPTSVEMKNMTYQGHQFPQAIGLKDKEARFTLLRDYPSRLKDYSLSETVPRSYWPDAIWIYGYDRENFSTYQRRKINHWASNNGLRLPRHIVLTPDRPKSKWLDPHALYRWESIAATKLPRNAGTYSSNREAGAYEAYIDGELDESVQPDDIDASNNVFYFVGKPDEAHVYSRFLWKNHSTFVLVCLPRNREAKFNRVFPDATRVQVEAERIYKEWKRKLTPVKKEALAIQDSYNTDGLDALDHTKIDDPDLRRAIRLNKRDLTKLNEERRMFRNLLHVVVKVSDFENPLDKYPLFSSYEFRHHPNHTYIYLNAAYAASKGA